MVSKLKNTCWAKGCAFGENGICVVFEILPMETDATKNVFCQKQESCGRPHNRNVGKKHRMFGSGRVRCKPAT